MEPITTIGRILKTEQHRDAIHMAILPVTAGERLSPGEHVGMLPDGTAGNCDKPLGIIDPFLTVKLKKGDQCWMFLYPNTITSLRHEWTHPEINGPRPPAESSKSASEKWMRAWAMENMSYDYYGDGDDPRLSEDAAYEKAIRAGHDLHIGPYESARDSIDNEWWSHWEIITGERGQRGEYFSCAC